MALVALLVSSLAVPLGTPAQAATVTELDGAWESPVPASLLTGELVNAVWHFNVNDDSAAPTNVDVPNVTVTFEVQKGEFVSIPDVCLTDASVTPASSISTDGSTLTCNVGTQKQGTALRVTTPIVAAGSYPDTVVALASSDGIHKTSLTPIPIRKSFGMDMAWSNGSSTSNSTDKTRTFTYNWTLFQDAGSIPGPNSVTYTINVDSTAAGGWGASATCAAFSSGNVSGNPWSSGTHPANQMAPFVSNCTLTRTATDNATGTATYTMTITGIDYSHALNPTLDSVGNPLPTGKIAIAAGTVSVTQTLTSFATDAAGSVQMNASAPTYTSVDSSMTDGDDTANNAVRQTWTTGYWSNAFYPWYTGSSAAYLSSQYKAGLGATVKVMSRVVFPSVANVSTINSAGECVILDSKYVNFSSMRAVYKSPDYLPLENLTTPQYWYYTGIDGGLLDPGSASYDPNVSHVCGATGAGWSTTPPADLSTVKAVKVLFPVDANVRATDVFLDVYSVIKPTTPIGQDVWEWGADAEYTGSVSAFSSATWNYYNRSLDPTKVPAAGTLTPVPPWRYPFAAGDRDVLKTVGSSPVVSKTVSPESVVAGDTVTYTVNYSASSSAVIPNRDGYTLVDTLPAGVTYVAGTASPATPAPVITTVGGKQVLTWTINSLPINTTRTITFQAKVPDTATSGQTFVNSITATVDTLSATDTATVKVPSDGLTRIAKVSDLAQIPNPDGPGDGKSSWTITITSADPRKQTFTDTIDVLPYNGDGRGTNMAGTYSLTGAPTVPAGATVYYSTATPSSINLDPADPSNGAAGNITGNSVGWSTTYSANATAIRVIGGALAPRATMSIKIPYITTGMKTGDTLVNTTWARASDTKLDMRTSASVTVAPFYAMSLKKYVLKSVDADPADNASWIDANESAAYPRYQVGDSVQYRVCVTNTGTGDLTNITGTDDLQPTKGAFTIAALAAGAKTCLDPYTVTYGTSAPSTVVNTASATTTSPDGPVASTDPAGIYLVNQGVGVVKSSDPADGSSVLFGSSVTYTLTFKSTGTTESYVDYVDHLTGVLDDATLDETSLVSSSPQLAGAYVPASQTIRISGYVAAGQTVTFSYTVTVNTVDQLGDADLLNVVTPPGTTPPSTCEPGDPLCTEHPVLVPTLTLKKNILVARYADADQFQLSIKQVVSGTATEVASATTSGTAIGVQAAEAKEERAVPTWTYRISETGVSLTDLSTYTWSASCSDSSGATVATTAVSGSDATWELAYPSTTIAESVTCTITNEPLYKVQVSKLGRNCDVGEPTCPLLGAEFALYDGDPTAGGELITDGIAVDPAPADGSSFTSVGLRVGEYWLVETKAPTGFSLLAQPIRFSLAAAGVTLVGSDASVAIDGDDAFMIDVFDGTAAPLPLAGGSGPWPFVGFGLALMFGAAVSFVESLRSARPHAVSGGGVRVRDSRSR